MASAGILRPDDRVELIDGEIFEMSSIGPSHAGCVNRLNRLFSTMCGEACIVHVQNPVQLDPYSQPEPDLALLRPRSDFYSARHPIPEDVMLLVEVADASLAWDRGIKVPLYARAGIAETWVVDLPVGVIHRHRDPADGTYRSAATLTGDDPLPLPDACKASLTAREILCGADPGR